MTNKKITVVGDGAEQPLTPEEEQRIEKKIDAMLDPSVPDSPVEAEAHQAQIVAPQHDDASMSVSKTDSNSKNVAPDTAPKITKIVTTFADDSPVYDDTIETTAAELQTKLAPQLSLKAAPHRPALPDTPKPVAKKIHIHHHEEPTAEVPDGLIDAAYPKPMTKKSAKKSKIAPADGVEVIDLADAITASALAAEVFSSTNHISDEAARDEQIEAAVDNDTSPKGSNERLNVNAADVELPETVNEPLVSSDDTSGGAPPLIRKHEATLIDPNLDTASELVPVNAKKISVFQQVDDETSKSGVKSTESTETTDSAAAHIVTEIRIDEPEEFAEKINVEVEPKPQPVQRTQPELQRTSAPVVTAESGTTADDSSAKYRPPAGPMQFKRAEVPIQPHKPGEPRPQDASAEELSEDAALAKAFETPESNRKAKSARASAGKGSKKLIWVVALLIIAGIAGLAAVPTLRHKALNVVGLDGATPKSSVTTVSPAVVVPTSAPAAQDVYIAKREGIYNVYRTDLTGQQAQLVLGGTGNEENNVVFAPNATSTVGALVSTRDGKKGTAGYLQQSLALVTVADGKVMTVDTADNVKLIDWFGNKIVYVLSSASTSTTDTNRYQIVSYDTATKSRVILDHANYLNDVLSAKGAVYYASASNSASPGQFISIKPDATAKTVILSAEVSAITRTDYNQLTLSTVDKWYSYQLGQPKATQTNTIGQKKGRLYIDSADGKRSAFISDTKITIQDTATLKATLLPITAAEYPLRWLNNTTIVYRSGEADFSLKISDAQVAKVIDVADVAGISLWRE
ncbi:hypothetical protein H7097_01795 [Aeromicrobium sp.]|nr:hypothetical protein [Candidatus Saccharibacteria bacterium]